MYLSEGFIISIMYALEYHIFKKIRIQMIKHQRAPFERKLQESQQNQEHYKYPILCILNNTY